MNVEMSLYEHVTISSSVCHPSY